MPIIPFPFERGLIIQFCNFYVQAYRAFDPYKFLRFAFEEPKKVIFFSYFPSH